MLVILKFNKIKFQKHKIQMHNRMKETELTLLNPGSMLPDSTTTTGDSLPVTHIKPFQIISAEVTIIPESPKTPKRKY